MSTEKIKNKSVFALLTPFDWILWSASVLAIAISFFAFHNTEYHYLIGAIIGVTGLIFIAKGHPLGPLICICFSVFYGIISYSYAYYGEMITYLGMTTPASIVSLITWLKNPYSSASAQIEINSLSVKEYLLAFFGFGALSTGFYFLLGALGTSNLLVSTLSVWTSLTACYLSIRRSRFYAIAYALNDIVLIVLWTLASLDNVYYIPMVVEFIAFLVSDSYGFVSWTLLGKKQKEK